MKEILDYISNNSFLTTIIGALSGGLFSFLTAIYINKNNEKLEIKREKRRQFENKAELRIIKSINHNNKPDIEIFLVPFKIDYLNRPKDYKIIFPKNILCTKKHKYKDFYIKNIGNADINYLDICTTSKKNTALFEYSMLKKMVELRFIDYSFCYDRKILKNETICIRIYYLEKAEPEDSFSSTLAILYKDSFNNLYKQSLWYEKDNLYEPHKISYKEYRSYVTIDDALYCFENPWMW